MSGTANIRILLVDDDPAILRLLSKWLAPHDYEIVTAANGHEAANIISSDPPQLVITDWNMPEMDGLQLCQWLRAQQLSQYIYVLFLSVRCGSQDMIQALEAGADDFLRKPIDKGELLARVRGGIRVLELESRLSLLAKTDALTGLSTHHTLHQALQVQCDRAARQSSPLSCVLIDIDAFGRINDLHGHLVGDDVIRRIGRTILTGCRSSDVVARYAGEEFCILLPDTDEEHAILWAERIRQTVGALEFAVDRESLRVTTSTGVVQFTDDMVGEPDRLVKMAEEALLVAKNSGRDRVVGHSSLDDMEKMGQTRDEAHDLFGPVTAGDVMTHLMAGLNKNLPIGSAAEYFLRFRIPSAPVVDEEGNLVGILSERDVMGVMLWPNWETTRVEQVMKTNVITFETSTPVMKVYEFLCRVPIRAVVIVEEGRPTGILSRSSLVRWFTNASRTQRIDKQQDVPAALTGGPREQASNVALALQNEVERLSRTLASSNQDAMTAVVGGASRMQELMNDLLAVSPHLPAEMTSV